MILQAGTAVRTINPAVGDDLCGQLYRRTCGRIRDDLEANLLYLADGRMEQGRWERAKRARGRMEECQCDRAEKGVQNRQFGSNSDQKWEKSRKKRPIRPYSS